MNYQVFLWVLFSFFGFEEENFGIWICNEDEIVEKQVVNGVIYLCDEVKIMLYGMEDKLGILVNLFVLLV